MQQQNHKSQKMTDKIIDKTKREKMNDVFDLLDSDSDGLISSKRIDIETIPGEVLEVFTPLLQEMEDIAQTLDRDEFVEAALRLYQTLNVADKNIILTFKKNQDFGMYKLSNDDCTFKPEICKKSV